MWNSIGFNLIYWSPTCGQYFLDCSFLEKCGKIWKNGPFSGRLRPDWGNTARAAPAGLGSKGLRMKNLTFVFESTKIQPYHSGLFILSQGHNKH